MFLVQSDDLYRLVQMREVMVFFCSDSIGGNFSSYFYTLRVTGLVILRNTTGCIQMFWETLTTEQRSSEGDFTSKGAF